ncbi:MAG: recombination mediator RecR [Bacteroidia bacterium]|nr:recombination mediator RecR [Bacteroidia bacterium]
MQYPSDSIQSVVEAFCKLPGIGKRSALRLALHLLKCPEQEAYELANAILQLRQRVKRCKICYNLTEQEICGICSNSNRNHKLICVVGEVEDVLAIEKTQQFNGVYHVLGGLISPLSGIGPAQLNITSLVERAMSAEEIILALSASIEGETTAFYIARQVQALPIRITSLARGIPVGSELQYADEITLVRSLQNRIEYSSPRS